MRIETKQRTVVPTVAPVQIISGDELGRKNSVSVADAVKYFAGVTVKDYGGIGGLKTVSVRSLGANHTGILYDGLMSGHAQAGQTDLGKFSLSNVKSIGLYNGSVTGQLFPARAYASASLITITTIPATAAQADKIFSATISGGSFGYFSPAVFIGGMVRKNLYLSVSGDHISSRGNYPFSSYDTVQKISRRKNSEVRNNRAELNSALYFNDSNKINLKAGYLASYRDLPGSVIFYGAAGNENLNDKDFYVQTSWRNKVSNRSAILVSSKLSRSNTRYLDPSYPNSYGRLENIFKQQEAGISASYGFSFTTKTSASFSSDYYRSSLRRTDFLAGDFARPDRNAFFSNLSLEYKTARINFSGNVLFTNISEIVANGEAGKDYKRLSPAVAVSLVPFSAIPVTVRFFYKNSFRPPSFNDLYYTNIGNTALRPESAHQFNSGVVFVKNNYSVFSRLSFSADSYLNFINDRILATPRQNLFQWSMQNVGEVKIHGVDATAHAEAKSFSGVRLSADASYSFQKALDYSDKSSAIYKTQLPYTPLHSGSYGINADYKHFSLSCNNLFSSRRFRAGDAIAENLVAGFTTTDLSFGFLFDQEKGFDIRLKAEANNILNNQYEIIKFYPMPRFNYRLGISITSKKQKSKQ